MDIAYQMHLTDFEKQQLNAKKYKEIEELRIKFITDFSINQIKNMKLDEYMTGTGDKTTFCNRIENELKAWGNMHGSSAIKFGIYYGRYGDVRKDYRIAKKFGDDLGKAFNKLKTEIINLIEAGGKKDYIKIKNNLLSPMLKGKILSLYYPNEFLNIFSSSHLDYFMNQLNLTLFPLKLTEIDKQKIILEFKNSDEIMKSWTVFKFSRFLYYLFGSPTNKKIEGIINTNNKTALEIFPKCCCRRMMSSNRRRLMSET